MIKSKTYRYRVPENLEGKHRLRKFLKGLFPYLETGSAVKKALQKKQIKLNDKIGSTGDWVTSGSTISFDLQYENTEKEKKPIQICYQDQDLIIVRKPPGISSSGNSKSFQSQLQSIEIEDTEGSLPFPYLVHRLDKATEGLLIAAKNIKVRRLLADMLEQHSIVKQYVVIVEGRLSDSLKWISADIDGKPAKTEILSVEVLDTIDPTTRVYLRIHTGRTHQIRKHFSEIGHPVVGDQIYNEGGLTFGTGLLLCAYYLEFLHPITGETIKVEYLIPGKINKYRAN